MQKYAEEHRFPNIRFYVDDGFSGADFADYRRAQKHMVELYKDKDKWNRMSLMNISGAGRFAADRAINEYARDIWHTKSAFEKEENPEKPVAEKTPAKKPAEKKTAEKKAPAKKSKKR